MGWLEIIANFGFTGLGSYEGVSSKKPESYKNFLWTCSATSGVWFWGQKIHLDAGFSQSGIHLLICVCHTKIKISHSLYIVVNSYINEVQLNYDGIFIEPVSWWKLNSIFIITSAINLFSINFLNHLNWICFVYFNFFSYTLTSVGQSVHKCIVFHLKKEKNCWQIILCYVYLTSFVVLT